MHIVLYVCSGKFVAILRMFCLLEQVHDLNHWGWNGQRLQLYTFYLGRESDIPLSMC